VASDVPAPAPPAAATHEHVAEHGPLTGAWCDSLALGLAEALREIHRARLVHRDLKPSNVLLSASGPKVIDFGIARLADATALTRTGFVVGTPGYLAPEQLSGEGGAPADVFAWGLTVAYAATGRTPFRDGPAEAIMYRLLHETPDLTAVPASLRGQVQAALAKAPERRPPRTS
jgi:serine/threonine protein kinase